MKLPKRPQSHLIEAESWRVLQTLAPKEWIVREVTERDYGIDCYIEICSKEGEITGDLISVQLKGTQRIKWKESTETKYSRSPSINSETAFYWLNLPVPVFLFVAELSTNTIYFVSVEEQIRANYKKLNKQKTISFLLYNSISLNSDLGKDILPALYYRERLHNKFVFHMTNLLSHIDTFCDFIRYNQQRDCFMVVESERHLQFRALYESCKLASLYLSIEWPIESLDNLYEMDEKNWKDSFDNLHEHTLDYALQKIEKVFPKIIKRALKIVCEIELDYWLHRDIVFFNLCSNFNFDCVLNKLRE